MNQNTLFKGSLIITLVGILLLLFLANNFEPKLISIKEINNAKIDAFVKVRGNITNFKQLEGMFILNTEDESGEITVIGYDNKVGFEKGNQIEIIGKVIEYERKLEIEATKIKLKIE